MDEFAAAVQRAVIAEGLFEPDSKVVVGLSGGPDSTALVLALSEFMAPDALVAAHLNHGLRGAEAELDQAAARDLAGRQGLEFITAALTAAPESNREENLRERRYDFLARAVQESGAVAAAVGHHAGDAAETLLLNLTRGAGPEGLSSMRVRSVLTTGEGPLTVVRPLLGRTRSEITSYLARRGETYREDSTNLDLHHPRNRIRLEVMPLLEKINPEAVAALARCAAILEGEARFMEEAAREVVDQSAREGELDLAALRSRPSALRLAAYRELIRRGRGDLRRLAGVHLAALDRLVFRDEPHGSLDLPGFTLRREYDRLSLVRDEIAEGPAPPELILVVPGEVVWPGPDGVAWTVRAAATDETGAPDHLSETIVNGRALHPPLVVRTRRPGERFRPAGMDGSRSVKKVMNELRIPPSRRDHWPILSDGDGIVWVPGLRPAERVRLVAGSGLLRITITPGLDKP